MADVHSPEKRSYNMSRIQSQNTKPEEKARKYLFTQEFRYRKNVKTLPGSPDIVLPKFKTVIFVHGCFWHMHNCGRFHWPATNQEYWEPKIKRNVQRDKDNQEALTKAGCKVLVVWECELKARNFDSTMSNVIHFLMNQD